MRSTDPVRRTLAEHPDQPTTPVEALLHTLAICTDRADDDMAVTATSGVYGDTVRTGLTWGDLRALAAELGIDAGTESGPGPRVLVGFDDGLSGFPTFTRT